MQKHIIDKIFEIKREKDKGLDTAIESLLFRNYPQFLEDIREI